MHETLMIRPRRGSESLSAYAYWTIYNNILQFRLKPDQPINEGEIAALLGVSRTPVHEAMAQLREDGLIDILPRKESKVSKINLMQVCEGITARVNIETQVILLAIGRIPPQVRDRMQQCLDMQESILRRGTNQSEFYIYDRAFHSLCYTAIHKENVDALVQKISLQGLRVSYLVDFDRMYFQNIEYTSANEHQLLFEVLTGQRPLDFDLHDFLYNHVVRFQKYFEPYIDKYRSFFSFTGTELG